MSESHSSPWRLVISERNTKIGQTPNVSCTPGKSCPPGVPCFSEGCYAQNAYNRYPNVRTAWDSNLKLWETLPNQFYEQLKNYLLKSKPFRFRWHVGGDAPDPSYLLMMRRLASDIPETKFLAFTKWYDRDYAALPANLVIVLSAWPGLDFKENPGLPSAWLAEDPRAPLDAVHIRCPGQCNDLCNYLCWTGLAGGMNVIFDRH